MRGITITMKYRFKALPVNSWGYYEVRERYEVMRRHGLDRYMASLTRIALMDKHETVETTMKNTTQDLPRRYN